MWLTRPASKAGTVSISTRDYLVDGCDREKVSTSLRTTVTNEIVFVPLGYA